MYKPDVTNIPFMFTSEYFIDKKTLDEPSINNLNATSPIVFPPVSMHVPIFVSSTAVKRCENISNTFHCGNKNHDSLFVCFYVLKNKDAMLYHRNAQKWNVLERQHKIEFAARLRDDKHLRTLSELFPRRNSQYASPGQIDKIDDELSNDEHPCIGAKTFITLCWMYCIPIILINDDMRTMCVIQNNVHELKAPVLENASLNYPKHSVTTIQGNSYIMWNHNLDVLQQKLTGYINIMPHEVPFASQLMVPIIKKNKTNLSDNNAIQKDENKNKIKNKIKSMGAYKMEELQALCIAWNISYTDISGSGKANKILKKDLYDAVVSKL